MNFEILSLSSFIFHFRVSPDAESSDFFCSFVYGSPYWRYKEEFWSELIRLGGSSDKPWVCTRDFNEVMRENDKKKRSRCGGIVC